MNPTPYPGDRSPASASRNPQPPPYTPSTPTPRPNSAFSSCTPPVADTLLRVLVPSSAPFNRSHHAGPLVRILIDSYGPPSEFDIVFIAGDPRRPDADHGLSPLQRALVSIFEECEQGKEDGAATCRLLAPTAQVGCVLGKGGKIIERLRAESDAHIRVLKKEQAPLCVGPGDELIHISGSYTAVRKAVISVSGCLQDYHRHELISIMNAKGLIPAGHGSGSPPLTDKHPQRNFYSSPAPEYHTRSYSGPGQDIVAASPRVEREVLFRILCPNEKVGIIIGKSGCTIRALQSESGASVKIADPVPDSDERVIIVVSRECSEMMHSPSQEAVLRLYSILAQTSMDKGSFYPARLLMPSYQVSHLLGRGGNTIAEMRKRTGADIRIFVREQAPGCAQLGDELVQVSGSFQSIQDALFHITSIIRDVILPVRPHQVADRRPPVQYYGSEMAGLPSVKEHISPRAWHAEVPSHSTPRGISDTVTNMDFRGGGYGTTLSENKATSPTSTTTEVLVPSHYLKYIYGDNGSDLAELRKMSGAVITVHDPRPGEEHMRTVTIHGDQEQTKLAQSLLHAFILCGLYSSS